MSAPVGTPVGAPGRAGERAGASVLRVPVLGTPVRRRAAAVGAALAAAAAALAVVGLATGDYPLALGEVVRALVAGDGPGAEVVRGWRLPRVVVALAFGAALGVAGAVFQSLTRNPLGSPDVIGFTTGAYTGALVVLTAVPASGVGGGVGGEVGTAAGALAGGLLTALVVYALASVRGTVQAFRLIVVGIAVTAVLHSVNTWLLLRAAEQVAMVASIWGAGSISLVGWGEAVPALVALAVLAATAAVLSPALRQLELGDDAARAHGVRTEPARLALVVVGVALTAVVTATAGPIAFVALAAPQVAHRLTRSAGLPLAASALVGAVLLLGADLVAQRLPGGALPVGIVTVVGGGVYLVVLLVAEARRRA